MAYNTASELFTGICDAIRGKDGTSALIDHQDIPDRIAAIEGGGGPVPSTGDYQVRFFDYDGTLLKDEWVEAGGTATFPPDPSHEGLTFQGWNHVQADLTNINRDFEVGVQYITSDGKTRAKIRLTAASGLSPNLIIGKSNSDELSIDWGDGTVDVFTDSGSVSASHTYSAAGEYVICLYMSSGTGTYYLGGLSGSLMGESDAYKQSLISVNLGSRLTETPLSHLYTGAFSGCKNLESISLANNITVIKGKTFNDCNSLKFVSLPRSILTIETTDPFRYCYNLKAISIPPLLSSMNSSYAFGNCSSLQKVCIPNFVPAFGTYSFQNCYSLESAHISNIVTTIPNYAFSAVYNLKGVRVPASVATISINAFTNCGANFYIFERTSTPTLNNINAFTGIKSLTKIFVPDGSVSAYKTATNWATYANYIYPISEFNREDYK